MMLLLWTFLSYQGLEGLYVLRLVIHLQPSASTWFLSQEEWLPRRARLCVCRVCLLLIKSYYICSVHNAGTGLIPGRKLTVIISTNLDSGHGRLCALWDTPEANCDLSAFLYKAVMAMD